MAKAPTKTAVTKKPRGGARPGAGKKKGTKNKRTIYREMKAAEVLANLPPLPGDLPQPARKSMTAVQYLQSILDDPQTPVGYKMDAAKALAPYQSPKLNSVTIKGDPNNPLQTNNTNVNMTPADVRKLARDLIKGV